MKRNSFRILIIIVALIAAGCRQEPTQIPPTIDNDQVATIVAATLNAVNIPAETMPSAASPTVMVETQTPQVTSSPTLIPNTSTPTVHTGEVMGRICYRTVEIPAMTAFFQQADSKDEKHTTELKVTKGQSNYSIDLEPGKYIAFAWVEDYSLGGLYSEAVLCGMRIECTDHTAITFEVRAGEKIEDINICDWYAFNVPQPPDRPAEEIYGSISGQIRHPDGEPPELHVVAFNLDTSYWYYTLTLTGATNFTLKDLPPGTYHVVAYQHDGRSGGYADGAHALYPVVVKAGETASASITDWDAPANAFLPDPTEW